MAKSQHTEAVSFGTWGRTSCEGLDGGIVAIRIVVFMRFGLIYAGAIYLRVSPPRTRSRLRLASVHYCRRRGGTGGMFAMAS